MKKLVKTAVALTAAALTTLVSPAFAAGGKSGKTLWNPSDPAGEILAGNRVCMGDKKLHTCATFVPLTEEIMLQQVSRPIGLSKNNVSFSVVLADKSGLFKRTSDGKLVQQVSMISEQANSAAIWSQGLASVPGAAFNGSIAAGIAAIANPCGGGGGCGNIIVGNGITAVAGSQSASSSTAAVQSLASCATTGVCR